MSIGFSRLIAASVLSLLCLNQNCMAQKTELDFSDTFAGAPEASAAPTDELVSPLGAITAADLSTQDVVGIGIGVIGIIDRYVNHGCRLNQETDQCEARGSGPFPPRRDRISTGEIRCLTTDDPPRAGSCVRRSESRCQCVAD